MKHRAITSLLIVAAVGAVGVALSVMRPSRQRSPTGQTSTTETAAGDTVITSDPSASDSDKQLTAAPYFVQGVVELQQSDGKWIPLDLGVVLREGTRIRTENGRLAVSLRRGRAFVIDAQSDLQLSSLAESETRLRLTKGIIYIANGFLDSDESFRLAPGAYDLRLSAGSFVVSLEKDGALLEVKDGSAEVAPPPQSLTVSTAQRLRLSGSSNTPEPKMLNSRELEELASRPLWDLTAGLQLPLSRLDIVGTPDGTSVRVDDLPWGKGPLLGLFPPGEHRVFQRDARGTAKGISVLLKADERTHIESDAVEWRPEVQPSTRAESQIKIKQMLAAHQTDADLRACFGKSTKEPLSGPLRLKVGVAARGEVAMVQTQDVKGSKPVSDCLASVIRRWKFPAGDRAQELDFYLVAPAAGTH